MSSKLENLPLKTVASQMAEAVVLADKEGRITWVNNAFQDMCGYSFDELKGQEPGKLLQGPDTDPDTIRSFHTAVKNRLIFKGDILNYHKNGRSYWVRISITPLRSSSGALKGFIAIEREVTKEKNDLNALRDDVVGLYATVLRDESKRGLKIEPNDPFSDLVRFDDA